MIIKVCRDDDTGNWLIEICTHQLDAATTLFNTQCSSLAGALRDPPEDARKVKAMLDITRGYTPECVAACIRAVEEPNTTTLDHAISLLPKGQPDAT